MVAIYIAHSRKDEELTKVVRANFESIGVDVFIAEETPETKPPEQKLDTNLIHANVVFLFLTPNVIGSSFTQAWIDYEVNKARELNRKPLLVFEEFNQTTQYPVVYFTHYILYDTQSIADWKNIQGIIQTIQEDQDRQRAGLLGGGVFGAIVGAMLARKAPLAGALAGGLFGAGIFSFLAGTTELGIPIKCPYCTFQFRAIILSPYYPNIQIRCPHCRKGNIHF